MQIVGIVKMHLPTNNDAFSNTLSLIYFRSLYIRGRNPQFFKTEALYVIDTQIEVKGVKYPNS